MNQDLTSNLQCVPTLTEEHHPNLQFYPKKVREAILAIPPERFLWDESKIIRFAYTDNIPPQMDGMLRLAFWAEYDRTAARGNNMVTAKICSGICSPTYFERYHCANIDIIQFITTEPFEQKKTSTYAHHLAVSEMVRLMKEPILTNTKTGLPDAQMWANKIKVFEYLDQRVNGPLPQHIVSKNLNVNVEAESPQHTLPETPEELERRMNEIVAQLQGQPSAPRLQLPTELVQIEAGRVIDQEFVRLDKRRDNQHRE